jgi:antitoxin component of MazEF toxin-antitoxin module
MPRQKTNSTNVRKITKVGKQSLAVTIPIELVRELKWKERQKVVVLKKGKSLIIKDWKK